MLIQLLRSLRERNVPLHAVGLQSHLRADHTIDRNGLQAFLRDIAELKLDVLITELDVIDNLLPPDVAQRDLLVSQRASAFLSSLNEVAQIDSLLTWGITDKYTWVPMYYKRADGLKNRPLPLTDQYVPKPLMATIAQFSNVPGL